MTYEFQDADANTIKAVGLRLIIQGILLCLIGIVGILYVVKNISSLDSNQSIVYYIEGTVECIVGLALLYSPTHFYKVASTKGHDIEEIIAGFRKLSRTFTVVWIIVAFEFLLDIVLFIIH